MGIWEALNGFIYLFTPAVRSQVTLQFFIGFSPSYMDLAAQHYAARLCKRGQKPRNAKKPPVLERMERRTGGLCGYVDICTFAVLFSFIYNGIIKGGYSMNKVKVILTDAEWRVIYRTLNDFKTKLHDENRDTDMVDDTLLKVIAAHVKKVKVAV